MNLTKTSRYAIRILCYMAADETKIHTARQMVEKLNLSDKYIRRLMTKLSKAGLINSIQGREGGYVFAKPADQIFLFDIVSAVEDIRKYTGCVLGFEGCSDDNPCPVHHKWGEARKPILHMFTTTSLHEIIESGFNGKF
jgi:Rrf2 family protein